MKCRLIPAGVALALLLATPSASLAQRQPPQQPQQPQTFRVMPFHEIIGCTWGWAAPYQEIGGTRQLVARNTLRRPLPAGTRVLGFAPSSAVADDQLILVEPLLPGESIALDVKRPDDKYLPKCEARAIYP